MSNKFTPQPQSEADFQMNYTRMQTLKEKCGGNKEEEIKKATRDAAKIKSPEKAYNRGFVAKELGMEHVFEVFFQRAYEIASYNEDKEMVLGVSVAEHREHMLKKIFGFKNEE